MATPRALANPVSGKGANANPAPANDTKSISASLSAASKGTQNITTSLSAADTAAAPKDHKTASSVDSKVTAASTLNPRLTDTYHLMQTFQYIPNSGKKIDSEETSEETDNHDTDDKLLGKGSDSNVYLQTYQNEPVAIKVYYSGRFIVEYHTHFKLQDSPYKVALLGVCFNPPALMLEKMSTDLEKVSWVTPHLYSINDRLQMLVDVCCGLLQMDAKRLYQFDLKGSNILITEDKRGKLADFGIVYEKSPYEPPGAPWFCASEFYGALPIPDKNLVKAVIFSFGLVMAQTFCNREEFKKIGEIHDNYISQYAWYEVHLQEYIETLRSKYPDYPDDYFQLIYDCITYKPNDRPSLDSIKTRLTTMLTTSFNNKPAGVLAPELTHTRGLLTAHVTEPYQWVIPWIQELSKKFSVSDSSSKTAEDAAEDPTKIKDSNELLRCCCSYVLSQTDKTSQALRFFNEYQSRQANTAASSAVAANTAAVPATPAVKL